MDTQATTREDAMTGIERMRATMLEITVEACESVRPVTTTCAWCPGAKDETRRLVAEGWRVSHGMCPACWPAFRESMGLAPAPYPGGSR
jgi:hypothetical protein